jgi:hypothetical protein
MTGFNDCTCGISPHILYPLHSTCTVMNPSYCTLYIPQVQSLNPVILYPLHSTCKGINPCHTVPFTFNMLNVKGTVRQGLMTVLVECKGYSMTGVNDCTCGM